MIYLHVGQIGSGKTYSATWEIYQEILKGTDVYVDWPIDLNSYIIKKENSLWAKFKRLIGIKTRKYGRLFYYKELSDIYGISNGVVYMDEAYKHINARKWENTPSEFIQKMSQSRHYHCDLHFICQYPNQIENVVRNLANIIVVHSRFIWFFVHKEYDASEIDRLKPSEVNPPKSFYTGITLFRKSFAKIYDTHAKPEQDFKPYDKPPVWSIEIYKNWFDELIKQRELKRKKTLSWFKQIYDSRSRKSKPAQNNFISNIVVPVPKSYKVQIQDIKPYVENKIT